ncbi:alpha-hydroxy-acid oxidizing protein [Streptomyces sp. NPDC088350]|uniref:alpha-hydroxy-acid oxidizing protein n=1 Tax=Streptomyces sp. NPDC088350 TaxID=3365854 RepID=UPI0037F92EA2
MAYFRRSAGQGLSAAEAAPAWDGLRPRPHILRDVSTCDTSTTVLGTAVDTPVLVAPRTLRRRAHPEGEVATALGAAGPSPRRHSGGPWRPEPGRWC